MPASAIRHATPLLPALALLAATACNDPISPRAEEPLAGLPRALTTEERAIITGSNSFAFGLMRAVAAQAAGDSNLFVSPLSVSTALGMTMNGTAGETQAQFRRALGFGDTPLESANAAYSDLLTLLRGIDRGVDFRVANSTWADDGFPVRPEFTARVRESFGAEARTLDLQAPASKQIINDWVSAATAGKIPTILGDVPANAVMYLINAIYFNGTWRTRFDPERTAPMSFSLEDGTAAPVEAMARTAPFAYHDGEGYRAVDLPYGRGAFTMTVLLPDSGVTTAALLDRLDAGEWARTATFPDTVEVALRLPKFRLRDEHVLNAPLQALGIVDAFDASRADFSPLSPSHEQLEISEVRHKTFVDVHERGTEAAAVTSVEIIRVCACSTPFVVDRPFLFVLRERFSGAILFMGRFAKPPGPGTTQ